MTYRENGKVVGKAQRHVKAREYHEAREKVPIAEGSEYHGASMDEYESVVNGKRHLRVCGRELLGEVGQLFAAADTTFSVGERLPGCLWPIAPRYLAGRLSLLASQFEEHKVHSMHVHYVPGVPSTAYGSIAFYFRNDIAVPTIEIGQNELRHAATHRPFVQTPVWKEAHIEIDPEDAVNRYFDEESQEARLEVQGLIQVLCGDSLTCTVAHPRLGNLYIEYDIEFFGEALDYDTDSREMTLVTVSGTSAVGLANDGMSVVFTDGAPSADKPSFSVVDLPTGVSSVDELEGWVFYGTVLGVTGLFSNTPTPSAITWATAESDDEHRFQVGQAFWFGFTYDYTTAKTLMVPFGDLGSVTESWTHTGHTGSQLVWKTANFNAAADMAFWGTWVHLGD